MTADAPAPIRYGEHVRAKPGTPCVLCRDLKLQPRTDHCHAHGWVRGDTCPRCNTLMALIDRRISPRESSLTPPLTLAALVAHAGRCPDCEPFGVEDLGPTASLKPASTVTYYTTNIRLDDDQADAIKAYAKANGGISIAAAIRILLAQSLNGKEKS